MTEQIAPEVAVNTEVSDETVNEFFDKGALPEKEEKQEEVKAETKEESKEETKEEVKEEVKPTPEENYKKAMHEERMRRKEEQRKSRELEAKVKAMEERFQQIIAEQTKIPKLEEAPVDNLDSRLAFIEQQERARQEQAKKEAQEHQYRQESERVLSDYRDMAEDFKVEAPDFTDAYNHFVQVRIAEFKALGYSDDEAAGAALQDELQFADTLMRQGKNPAKVIYEITKARGWKKIEQKPEEKTISGDEKLKMLEKGTKSARLPSGAPSHGEVTLEMLAEMSDEEFAANWDKVMKR